MNKNIWIALLLVWLHLAFVTNAMMDSTLSAAFSRRYGQIEVGGPYAGVEFHHSRPLPSRISFYYPVANSIDLSNDYWRRDRSQPFRVLVRHGDQTDLLAEESWAYRYTPFSVQFEDEKPDYRCNISYLFCQNLPVIVWQFSITNRTNRAQRFIIESELQALLRTCQTYAWRRPQGIVYRPQEGPPDQVEAYFSAMDTDSAVVFIRHVAGGPIINQSDSSFNFYYAKELAPEEEWRIVQLIGTCKPRESGVTIARATEEWHQEVEQLERGIVTYAQDSLLFDLPDAALSHTARWARAMLASNRHYINGRIVPMPCPAEYNFFFTHDLLLTDLGAVFFDARRVKEDLLYLQNLARPTQILPHAYYWRNNGYQTEFCTSDNWNHLWFIILAASYLRHTADTVTVTALAPLLKKSLDMMLENKGADDLMYAYRPDWWDIGHVYGARAYVTTLMIRTLREFVYIGMHLGDDLVRLAGYLQLADRIQHQLIARLWNDRTGFLGNMLDTIKPDTHYYAGSLLAAAWNILDDDKSLRLLQTTKAQLLDRNLGIRIVMPADFHLLIEQYRFKGMEMGAPYLYINGGIWPHGIVWYALAWLARAEADTAREALCRYLTLEGVCHTPNGQPSFFEYRNADPNSTCYGEIDKPNFLWAGGCFLCALYQIAGVREHTWNLAFSPRLPSEWEDISYQTLVMGKPMLVTYKGKGVYFKAIRGDGRRLYTAVMTQPLSRLVLERGVPETPYLAEATAVVYGVKYDEILRRMRIDLRGVPGQMVQMVVISPFAPKNDDDHQLVEYVHTDGICKIILRRKLQKAAESVFIEFASDSVSAS